LVDKEIEATFQPFSYNDVALTIVVGHSSRRPGDLTPEPEFRKFFNHVYEWRVGLDEDTYSYVRQSAGLGPVEWEVPDPWMEIEIVGGTTVFHLVGNPYIEGRLYVRDLEALTQLLKTIDVSSTGGTQPAMSSSDRTVIDYFVISVKDTKIDDDSDTREDETLTFKFNNARIRTDNWNLAKPQSPVIVTFYADSVDFVPSYEEAWWIRSKLDIAVATSESLTFTVSSSEDLSLCLMRWKGLFDPAIFDPLIFDTISTPLTFLATTVADLAIATLEAQTFTVSSTLTLDIV
jgi:hypothetical protein